MTELDWQRVSSMSPENLSDDDLNFLYDSFREYNPSSPIDDTSIKLLFFLALEVVRFKGEEAEFYESDNKKLSAQLITEDLQRQELTKQIAELQALIGPSEQEHVSKGGENINDLREELRRMKNRNKELVAEVREREKEIHHEKKENEKIKAKVGVLEREKDELSRELSALNHEMKERSALADSYADSHELTEKQQELVGMIREKNKQITELLNDIKTIEKENSVLKNKLTVVRDQLAEATKNIMQLTGELTSLKCTCQEQQEKLNATEEQNAALRNQVKELVDQKISRDSLLDKFSEDLDNRIKEWKKILEKKDAEIEELHSRLGDLEAQAPHIQIDTERSRIALLTQSLEQREAQIEELQRQLAEAVREINESAAVIEHLKAKRSRRNMASMVDATVLATVRTQLTQAEEQVKLLEGRLRDAEEDAQLKAQAATEMIVQLREYEAGEYGLAEAVSQLKKTRLQCQVRDNQIAELVQTCNKLESQITLLDEQNAALRDKLNLPPDEVVEVEGLRSQQQRLLRVLQQQTVRLEEENLELRLENRKLTQRLNGLSSGEGSGPMGDVAEEEQRALVPLRRTPMPVPRGPMPAPMPAPMPTSMPTSTPVPAPRGEETLASLGADPQSAQLVALADAHFLEEQCQGAVARERELEGEVVALQRQLKEFITENDALRIGMHEILQSIHAQDGTSNVQIESECLERLLEALDARHISGWYHPAMRLQAQMQNLEGSNRTLREELRTARLEEAKARQELERAELRMEQLEQRYDALQKKTKFSYEEVNLPPDLPLSGAQVIANLNLHLQLVLKENVQIEEENKLMESKLEELNKKYSVIRHQMGLLYKQYDREKSEWKQHREEVLSEKAFLTSAVAGLEEQLKELRGHLEALGQSGDAEQKQATESAVRIAELLSTNQAAQRKCKTLQNLENMLRKENEKLKEDMQEMQSVVTKTVGQLQRQKEMALFQNKALQKKLEECVPLSALQEANVKINELTTKYRTLLQRDHNTECGNVLVEQMQKHVEILLEDKVMLTSNLQSMSERLHSMEVLVTSLNQNAVSQDNHDNQISALAEKLASAEAQGLAERQRADGAEKMLELIKGQCSELQTRMGASEEHSRTLQERVQQLQLCEQQLQDQLLQSVSQSEWKQLQAQCTELEAKKNALLLEKEKLRELADIALEQVRGLELWKLSQDLQMNSLQQQVLDMQSSGDNQAQIARLSHELLSARLNEANCGKKLQQVHNELTKQRTQMLHLEEKVEEKDKALVQLQNRFSERSRSLCGVIQYLREEFSGSLPLLCQERYSQEMRSLTEKQHLLNQKLWESQKALYEATSVKDDREAELNSLKELKEMLKTDDSKTCEQKFIMELKVQNSELRLKELRLTRKVEFFEEQYQQAEERLLQRETLIAKLEEQYMKSFQISAMSEDHLEQTQGEIQRQLSEDEDEKKVPEPAVDVPTKTETEISPSDSNSAEQLTQALSQVSSQAQSLLKYEREIAQLNAKVNSLSQSIQEKESLVSAKSLIITELQSQISSMKGILALTPVNEKEVESADKLALKATVDSLQNILMQKEETIGRYQQLLKESREELSKASCHFQEEIQNLQTALGILQQAYCRLRGRAELPLDDLKNPVTEKFLQQLQQRDDELAKVNTCVSNLSNQLQSSREEIDRLQSEAEERLSKMGELHQRLQEAEKQHQEEVALLQLQLKQQGEKGEAPSAVLQSCVDMLKAQLAEKEARNEMLSKSVIQLQEELKKMAEASTKEVLRPTQDGNPKLGTQSAGERRLASQLQTTQLQVQKLQEQLHRSQKPVSKESSLDSRFSVREMHLQKKIKSLEEEVEELKKKCERDEEFRRAKSSEEFVRWDERKKWQQNLEKTKQKLKEKSTEVDTLRKSYSSLRELVTRLEREKRLLESKVKSLKNSLPAESRIEALELENCQLQQELQEAQAQLLQMHQGGPLQQRIQQQQRRIAALELSQKGNFTVCDEYEKLQSDNITLQKTKARLEQKNAKLETELEKISYLIPQIKEHLQNLETSLALIKSEQELMRSSQIALGAGDATSETTLQVSLANIQKSTAALNRLLDQLCSEGKQKESSAESSGNRLRADHRVVNEEKSEQEKHYLREIEELQIQVFANRAKRKEAEERCKEASQEVSALKAELNSTKALIESLKKADAASRLQVQALREQLEQKTQLLRRVKQLLQQAAEKERALHHQVSTLQSLVPQEALPQMLASSSLDFDPSERQSHSDFL